MSGVSNTELTVGAFSKGKAILVDEFLRVCAVPLHLIPEDAEVGQVLEISVRINRKKQRAQQMGMKNTLDSIMEALQTSKTEEKVLEADVEEDIPGGNYDEGKNLMDRKHQGLITTKKVT
mmetsp:Transcript_34842/g.64504  ORF Transcript_34842/g.64504 Transcript_34842/m.64504 type:complete len:120 (-) Transcript_34842:180-539(-)